MGPGLSVDGVAAGATGVGISVAATEIAVGVGTGWRVGNFVLGTAKTTVALGRVGIMLGSTVGIGEGRTWGPSGTGTPVFRVGGTVLLGGSLVTVG